MAQTKEEIVEARSRALRYKRPALTALGYEPIMAELDEITDACSDIQYAIESDESGDILESMVGGEDEAWEFKMAFADLSAKAEELNNTIRENYIDPDTFDDCTVALLGNRYQAMGWDGYQEDYYNLTGYETEFAVKECGKRLMRMTKAEMLSTFSQCWGVTMAVQDLRQQYDCLKVTMDIVRDENVSLLDTIRDIERLYNAQQGEQYPDWREFDRVLAALPQRTWLE